LKLKSVIAAVMLTVCAVMPASAARYTILIAVWRGCEEACRGFQDYLKERRIDAEFIVRDAAQNADALPGIIAEARARKVDLMLTWGSSVTRGVAGRVADANDRGAERTIPKVFTMVADPVGLGVVKGLEQTGRADLTGTYNRVPEEVNIQTMRAYLPSFRRLGLLYNSNEKNSLLKRDEIARLAHAKGFELVALELPLGGDGRPQVADIAPRMAALKAAGVDFVYVGSSSFLRENPEAVTGAALKNGLPLLSPYEGMVRDSRALISVAARYYDVGRLAGVQAEKILVQGMRPGELPVLRMKDFAVVVNMGVARELKRFPPLDLLRIAETVD